MDANDTQRTAGDERQQTHMCMNTSMVPEAQSVSKFCILLYGDTPMSPYVPIRVPSLLSRRLRKVNSSDHCASAPDPDFTLYV